LSEDKTLLQAELAALAKEAHEKICPYPEGSCSRGDAGA